MIEDIFLPSLLERFIKNLENQKKSEFTIIAYKKDLEQFVGFLTSKEISDIREAKKEHIQEFINKLISDNYTKKSASRKLNSIRTFFRFLKQEGVIDFNFALDVSHPKYSSAPPRIFTKVEYRALRDYAREDARSYALVEILLQTGIRIGELANIRLSDIKENELVVRYYGKNPQREIPLNTSAKRAIEEYLKIRPQSKNDHLFVTRTGKPLLIRNIRQIISRCFREVEIKDATVNDLRNTFIAHQLMSGASIDYIAKLVGHKRLSSTERYLQLIKEETKRKEGLGEL